MGKMSGKAGSAVTPASSAKPDPADVADPGQKVVGKSAPQAPPHKPPKTDEEKEKSWIEIELVDESDQPVPGQRYEITLPDGSVAKGTLDEKGFARVEGIDPPGTCQVCFPELDKEAWEKA
jgi:type VI secretion system secreted protein VgrG